MTLPHGFGSSRTDEKEVSEHLPANFKEGLDGLNDKQFMELKTMICKRNGPLTQKVKEATVVHHSNRVILLIGAVVLIPMLAAIGWFATGEIWITLIMPTIAGLMLMLIFLGNRAYWDTYTRPDEKKFNRDHW